MNDRPMNGYHQPNFASSSSNPYSNDFSIHQQHIQHQQSGHQPQWSAPIRPNSIHFQHHQPQQQHHPQRQLLQQQQQHHPQQNHFNPSIWQDRPPQLPPQPFQTGNAPIPGFNMPFISQQIIQDAFAMSAPVEAADEKFLLQALIDSRNKKETYKDALNGLHGVSNLVIPHYSRVLPSLQKNGHSASLWKDYYLEHKDRLDDWIHIHLNPPRASSQTVKKPSPATFKIENSPASPPRNHSKQPKRVEQSAQSSKGRRSTINSLTAPEPVYDDRLPAPNAELRIPEPPLHSPSPPARIVPQGRGNKYTPEDREFFLKFISWRLKCDPTLNRNDLCAQLAEKVGCFPVSLNSFSLTFLSLRHLIILLNLGDLTGQITTTFRTKSLLRQEETTMRRIRIQRTK